MIFIKVRVKYKPPFCRLMFGLSFQNKISKMLKQLTYYVNWGFSL